MGRTIPSSGSNSRAMSALAARRARSRGVEVDGQHEPVADQQRGQRAWQPGERAPGARAPAHAEAWVSSSGVVDLAGARGRPAASDAPGPRPPARAGSARRATRERAPVDRAAGCGTPTPRRPTSGARSGAAPCLSPRTPAEARGRRAAAADRRRRAARRAPGTGLAGTSAANSNTRRARRARASRRRRPAGRGARAALVSSAARLRSAPEAPRVVEQRRRRAPRRAARPRPRGKTSHARADSPSPADGAAGDVHAPRGERQRPRCRLEQRRLARAVRADDRDDLARRDRERRRRRAHAGRARTSRQVARARADWRRRPSLRAPFSVRCSDEAQRSRRR